MAIICGKIRHKEHVNCQQRNYLLSSSKSTMVCTKPDEPETVRTGHELPDNKRVKSLYQFQIASDTKPKLH